MSRFLRSKNTRHFCQSLILIVRHSENMSYLGIWKDDSYDLWGAATEPAFKAYNKPNCTPEEQLVFVESLEKEQRYALVSSLFEAELDSGGFDGMVSCIGLLIPQIAEALAYYGADKHNDIFQSVLNDFDLSDFPRTQDNLMDKWDAYQAREDSTIHDAEYRYWELDKVEPLHGHVERNIKMNMQKYFENHA